eukprot:3247263-Pyramimonas_sp.AAC.1
MQPAASGPLAASAAGLPSEGPRCEERALAARARQRGARGRSPLPGLLMARHGGQEEVVESTANARGETPTSASVLSHNGHGIAMVIGMVIAQTAVPCKAVPNFHATFHNAKQFSATTSTAQQRKAMPRPREATRWWWWRWWWWGGA